jgi:oxaloacetate decarboxylase alpha subunit
MWMDQNLKDRLLGMRRAKELVVQKKPDIPLKELREVFGGTGVSDQEFLLRFIMKGTQEVEAMRAAGPPKPYYNVTLPLLSLIEELTKHKSMRYIYVQRGDSSLLVQNHSVP